MRTQSDVMSPFRLLRVNFTVEEAGMDMEEGSAMTSPGNKKNIVLVPMDRRSVISTLMCQHCHLVDILPLRYLVLSFNCTSLHLLFHVKVVEEVRA